MRKKTRTTIFAYVQALLLSVGAVITVHSEIPIFRRAAATLIFALSGIFWLVLIYYLYTGGET